MKKLVLSIGLNNIGIEYLNAFDEYYKENTTGIVKTSLAYFIKGFKNGRLVKVFEAGDREAFKEKLLMYEELCVDKAFHLDEALVFVKECLDGEHIRLVSMIDSKKKRIVIRKMIGLRLSDYKSIFSDTDVSGFRNGFAQTFMATFVTKNINNAVKKITSISKKEVDITVSSVYKVTNRNLLNIDVDFNIDLENISEDLINRIIFESGRFKEPIDYMNRVGEII